MSLNRRHFLQGTVAATAAIGVPQFASSSVRGANDEIRVAVVGLGVRGGGTHVPRMERQKGVRVVAVCDPDRQRLDSCVKSIEGKYQHSAEKFVDVRKMLEKKDIDVVCVATMQYWHALPTIWACQTGRDVYCEKPLSHFIREGQQMVAAARKYDRLVQVGTQARSTGKVIDTIKYIQEGNLGKIQYVTAFANKPRTSIGKRDTPLPIPDSLDYELWCGPARKGPIYRNRIQYDCSFTWNMGDGESCNQGVHEIDMARWLLGETQLPRRVMSLGGRFVFNDAGDVPNTQITYYDFPTAPVLYEVHNLRAAKGSSAVPTFRGERTGTCAQCEGGYAMIRSGRVYDNEGKLIKSFSGGESHFENFIRAVRSGRREDLHADILEGHRSTAITHTGNISYRLGKPAAVEQMRAAVDNTPVFNEMFDRYLVHLKAQEIDPATSTLGPWLEIDRENECFKSHDKANEIVKGFYRTPFRLPDDV